MYRTRGCMESAGGYSVRRHLGRKNRDTKSCTFYPSEKICGIMSVGMSANVMSIKIKASNLPPTTMSTQANRFG